MISKCFLGAAYAVRYRVQLFHLTIAIAASAHRYCLTKSARFVLRLPMKEFEWDDKKAEANLRKHKVSFENAQLVFSDPNHISEPDNRFDSYEERWRTIGRAGNQYLLLFVAHTIQENGTEIIRIISARRANKAERKHYDNRKI